MCFNQATKLDALRGKGWANKSDKSTVRVKLG